MSEFDYMLFLNKDCQYIDFKNLVCKLVESGGMPKGGPGCRCFDCLVALHYHDAKNRTSATSWRRPA